MLTTDFTGTYDYEKDEAYNAADYLAANLLSGYNTIEQHDVAVQRELAHWHHVLTEPGSFDDFQRHFLARLRDVATLPY